MVGVSSYVQCLETRAENDVDDTIRLHLVVIDASSRRRLALSASKLIDRNFLVVVVGVLVWSAALLLVGTRKRQSKVFSGRSVRLVVVCATNHRLPLGPLLQFLDETGSEIVGAERRERKKRIAAEQRV